MLPPVVIGLVVVVVVVVDQSHVWLQYDLRKGVVSSSHGSKDASAVSEPLQLRRLLPLIRSEN